MTHDDILRRATQSLGQAPDPEEQRIVDAHMVDCAGCRAEWVRMRAAHEALVTWGNEAPPFPVSKAASPAAAAPVAAAPIARKSQAWPLLVAATLAGAVLGAGGVLSVVGWSGQGDTQAAGPGPDPRPVFALLLEETPASWPLANGTMREGYVEWRDSLAADGAFAGGHQLTVDEGWVVTADGAALRPGDVPFAVRGATTYSGIFLVHAATYDEAIAIARGSPHLAWGAILVRGVR